MTSVQKGKNIVSSEFSEDTNKPLAQNETNQDLLEIIAVQQIEIDGIKKKSRWLFNEYNQMKKSFSWKITSPLRFLFKIFNRIFFIIKTFIRDIYLGFVILKVDGLSVFWYRLSWYFRGKRLEEDIEILKQKYEKTILLQEADLTKIIHVSPSQSPMVSIIIPMYNHFVETYNCVSSIVENTKALSYEIIIIDDHSSENIEVLEKALSGVKFITNTMNQGFLKSCNIAAEQAKGEYIHFLNNDTIVHPEWLSSLLIVFEKFEKVGIVGSKLIYPDGKLQEAGGIIWNDASGWNYGKHDDAEKSEYNYLKEVDYVSGASLMIKKVIWNQLNGFDEQFSPAYYEDTDLAYRVRELGLQVYYQPKSEITHFEGLSNGKEEQPGPIKKFQYVNRHKFLKKWHRALQAQGAVIGENAFHRRDRSIQKSHILVIDHQVPRFDQDAGSRSTYSYLKLFVEMGYSVKFFGQELYRAQPYTDALQCLGIEVLYGDYYQKNITNWLKENGKYFDFVFIHRYQVAQKFLKIIKKHSSAKVAYVGHDLQFISSLKKYNLTKEKKYKKESKAFKKIESKIFKTVDIILPFSTYEAPLISELVPEKIVCTLPVFFYQDLPQIDFNFNNRHDILFVAFFGHPPNVDAALWFCNEVFPIIRKQIPNIKLNIVGSNPTEEIKNLACEEINVTGYVTDEKLKEYYLKSKVAISPLRFGAGVKGKLLESLYYQIPTVITSVAAEGVHEIDKFAMIINDAESYAHKTIEIYTNKDTWEKYAANSKELIKKHYSTGAARKAIQELLETKFDSSNKGSLFEVSSSTGF
ncbi:glycosyltransferase [Lentimicrobium sp. S6]|uniref:glycosyltransferase n=1 Tax=Lentimicrobium sp. S6 TaxID=2735872 RepID=UPI0015541279|nr:glycosyltransferase [Lentimicrobium sp. S6]NPD47857.1 glycosyltransferase [Lentimicrobium sp. S6]